MDNRYWRSYRSEEFQEEDGWAVIKEDGETGFKNGGSNGHISTPRSISRRLPSAARMIPGAQKHKHIDNNEPKVVQSSAPVRIPDWSKIHGKNPRKKCNDSCSSSIDHDNDDDDDDDYHVHDGAGSDEEDVDYGGYDDNDDDDDGRLPPHEWLVKKLSRNQISSFSVCEGVGRTLKGRDLSRVRNAVLSRTGFL